MMKVFRANENPAAGPLLAEAKESPGARLPSSSDGDGDADEMKQGPLKTLARLSVCSPLTSLSCQTSPAAHAALTRNSSACSTVQTSSGSTPNPSPKEWIRKELPIPTPMQHGHGPTVCRRDDSSYRHDRIVSPTAIVLKKRSTTLPTYFTSPTLLLEGRDDDLTIEKTRSEGISRHTSIGKITHSYDCNYRYSLEGAYEDFGVERRLVELQQARSKEDGRASRGRTSTYPGAPLSPAREAESRPRPGQGARHAISARANSTQKSVPVDIDEFDEEISRRHGENIKSEFSRRGNHRESKSRRHSYDCNYPNQPLKCAYEKFCVERQLTELKQLPEMLKAQDRKKRSRVRVRSMKEIVRKSTSYIARQTKWTTPVHVESHRDPSLETRSVFGGDDSSSDDGRANEVSNRKLWRGNMVHSRGNTSPSSKKINVASKTKVIAKALRFVNRRDCTKEDCRVQVPYRLVATTIITPTNLEDHADNDGCLVTPEDMRLFYKWRTARVRGASATDDRIEARITTMAPSSGRKNYEDVLSITSSCGDKTAPVDNRRGGPHRQGCSF